MNKTYLTAIAGSVLLAVACTGGEPSSGERSEVTLSVEGINAGDFSSALFVLADVEARADGQQVAVSIDKRRANLANPTDELRLRVQAPEGAKQLEIVLRLDDYGAFATASAAGEIDTRGSRIFVRAPTQALLAKPSTAVRVDLGRSLIPMRVDKRLFLPHYGVSD